MIKLVKNKDIVIPPIVFHAGSERSSEEREMWKVFYRGVIKVCYRCLKEGHLGRDCQDAPVSMEYLASQPDLEEAPAAPNEGDVISGERRTFAHIVKDASFVETRLARQRAAELKREKIAAKAREAKEKRETRKIGRKGMKSGEEEWGVGSLWGIQKGRGRGVSP
jgi:hypothetical protein